MTPDSALNLVNHAAQQSATWHLIALVLIGILFVIAIFRWFTRRMELLEGKLWKANATSPKLAAVRQWLDNLTLAAAANPDEARPDWPAAPFAFDAVLAEALAALNAQ